MRNLINMKELEDDLSNRRSLQEMEFVPTTTVSEA